jgi:hypothetical protein
MREPLLVITGCILGCHCFKRIMPMLGLCFPVIQFLLYHDYTFIFFLTDCVMYCVHLYPVWFYMPVTTLLVRGKFPLMTDRYREQLYILSWCIILPLIFPYLLLDIEGTMSVVGNIKVLDNLWLEGLAAPH